MFASRSSAPLATSFVACGLTNGAGANVEGGGVAGECGSCIMLALEMESLRVFFEFLNMARREMLLNRPCLDVFGDSEAGVMGEIGVTGVMGVCGTGEELTSLSRSEKKRAAGGEGVLLME